MPRLLNMLMGRAALLMSPDIDDTANGLAYEKQFTGADPDDSDTPGANQSGADVGVDDKGKDTGAPAPAPAPAAAPPAPAAAPPAPAVAPAPAAAPGAAPAPAAAPAAAAPPAPDPVDIEYVAEIPAPQRHAPADADAQLTTLGQERQTAYDKMIAGDIETEEYRRIDNETRAKEQKLHTAIAQDAALESLRVEQGNVKWADMKTEAVHGLKALGIQPTKENLAALEDHIGDWAAVAARRGMQDGPNLVASKWALDKAVAAFKGEKGIGAAAPAPAPAAAAAAAAAPAAKPALSQAEADKLRAVDRGALPPTLALAPAAADATVQGDRFAHIDALEGVAQEKAIAAMSKAEEAEYLSR